MSMERRTVEESMIYIVFTTTRKELVPMRLVRYADAKRAVEGINRYKECGYLPTWAIQGRRRTFESILEEGS